MRECWSDKWRSPGACHRLKLAPHIDDELKHLRDHDCWHLQKRAMPDPFEHDELRVFHAVGDFFPPFGGTRDIFLAGEQQSRYLNPWKQRYCARSFQHT